jgi:hypothetical protein
MQSTDLESMRVESNNVVAKNKNWGRRAPARKVGVEAVGVVARLQCKIHLSNHNIRYILDSVIGKFY